MPMKKIKDIILGAYSGILCLLLKYKGITVGKGGCILGMPRIKRHPGSEIHIGHGAMVFSKPFANPLGPIARTFLHTMAPSAKIMIGDHAGLSATTIVARELVSIGARTFIGADCLICDNDFHSLDYRLRNTPSDSPACAPVTVGDDVFIGTRSIILKGVTIGDRCVVGAGSVVSKSIPSDSLAAGCPAKVIRRLR